MSKQLIVVSSETGDGLQSPVAHHFGRCPFFTLVQVVDGKIEDVQVQANQAAGMHRPGLVPQLVKAMGADIMLSGGMGGRAVGMFQQWGITPITGATGTVEEAVVAFCSGGLEGYSPCTDNHHEGGHGCGDHHEH